MNLSLVKAQHTLWCLKLNLFLFKDQEEPEACLSSYRECSLGKWLYTQGLTQFATFPEIRSLERVHRELHAMGEKIIQLKKSGNLVLAQQEFVHLQSMSQQLFDLIEKLAI